MNAYIFFNKIKLSIEGDLKKQENFLLFTRQVITRNHRAQHK